MSRIPSKSGQVDRSSEEDVSSEYSQEESSEENSSSSEEEQLLLKPVFLSKAKRSQIQSKGPQDRSFHESNRAKEITLSNLENTSQDIDVSKIADDDFNGIDDTDDLDPEQEYLDWRKRELQRYKRDQQILKQKDLIKEDQVRRSNLTESELMDEFKSRKIQTNESSKGNSSAEESNSLYEFTTGKQTNSVENDSFVNSNENENNNDNDNDNKNKSSNEKHMRPTKLKFKRVN
ncbi:uncharacterized protein RJT21DRAFT_116349 [Scheffersomyces amazonensis]|uniref:uncharacterized protein n=1 Tax=Scheffersomyces amazonensis TaxID=1078765 RepID=UPI00315D8286